MQEKRVSMRKTKEILRLALKDGLSQREIAVSTCVGKTTIKRRIVASLLAERRVDSAIVINLTSSRACDTPIWHPRNVSVSAAILHPSDVFDVELARRCDDAFKATVH